MTREELFKLIHPAFMERTEKMQALLKQEKCSEAAYLGAAVEFKRFEQQVLELLDLEQSYSGPIKRGGK